MKVLFVNTYDKGGAAIACIRLYNELVSIDSALLLKAKTKQIINAQEYPVKIQPPPAFFEKLRNIFIRIANELSVFRSKKTKSDVNLEFLNQRPIGLEYFSFIDTPFDITESKLYEEADIIHFHWVANFLDWRSFFAKNKKPLVWTLHDQNPFLGGQHYDEKYLGINDLGYPITREMTPNEIAMEKELLDVKKEILQTVKNIHLVSPSQWLLELSQNSELFQRFSHYLISNGVPLDVFKPIDKKTSRHILGFPQDKKIILFVADSVGNYRKGFVFLQRAFEQVLKQVQRSICLCSVGRVDSKNEQKQSIIELGVIQDERLMAVIYNAADLFVIPSLEDNLPNTMIESLCCGTPVLGFPTGGIAETIINEENGILCDQISVDSLATAILNVVEGKINFDSNKISEKAREKFSAEKQAKAYIKLYQEILKENDDIMIS